MDLVMKGQQQSQEQLMTRCLELQQFDDQVSRITAGWMTAVALSRCLESGGRCKLYCEKELLSTRVAVRGVYRG